MCSGNCETNAKIIMENQQLIYDKQKLAEENLSYIIDYLDKLAPVINDITVNTAKTVKILESKKEKAVKKNAQS